MRPRIAVVLCASLALLTVAATHARAEAEPGECVGTCVASRGGPVEVADLLRLVNIALGLRPTADCANGDVNGNGILTIEELMVAIANALEGCTNFIPVPGCGNGVVDGEEECDDEFNVNGDGCSGECRVEGPDPVDQEWRRPAVPACGSTSGSLSIARLVPVAQEFIPRVSRLSGIAVGVGVDGAEPNTLTAVVRAGDVGGAPLGSATATLLSEPRFNLWQRFDFSPPISVTPGARYVIELQAVTGNPLWRRFQWEAPCALPLGYADGTAIVNGEPGANDFLFRTFGR